MSLYNLGHFIVALNGLSSSYDNGSVQHFFNSSVILTQRSLIQHSRFYTRSFESKQRYTVVLCRPLFVLFSVGQKLLIFEEHQTSPLFYSLAPVVQSYVLTVALCPPLFVCSSVWPLHRMSFEIRLLTTTLILSSMVL